MLLGEDNCTRTKGKSFENVKNFYRNVRLVMIMIILLRLLLLTVALDHTSVVSLRKEYKGEVRQWGLLPA